jgi:hypothetical protein
MAIIQMVSCVWQWNLICIAKREENQRVIWAFLDCVTINQIRLIDKNMGILNERNRIPV